MIKIFGDNDTYKEIARLASQKTLEYFGIDQNKVDIEINFISGEYIKDLNNRFRNLDKITDVLSFANISKRYPYNFKKYKEFINPEDNSLLLGEIFICAEKAELQAIEYGNTAEREILFLTIHGILHLLGFNHIKNKEEKDMNIIQDRIINGIEI